MTPASPTVVDRRIKRKPKEKFNAALYGSQHKSATVKDLKTAINVAYECIIFHQSFSALSLAKTEAKDEVLETNHLSFVVYDQGTQFLTV